MLSGSVRRAADSNIGRCTPLNLCHEQWFQASATRTCRCSRHTPRSQRLAVIPWTVTLACVAAQSLSLTIWPSAAPPASGATIRGAARVRPVALETATCAQVLPVRRSANLPKHGSNVHLGDARRPPCDLPARDHCQDYDSICGRGDGQIIVRTGSRRLRRSEVRRFAFASSSLPLRASALFRRS